MVDLLLGPLRTPVPVAGRDVGLELGRAPLGAQRAIAGRMYGRSLASSAVNVLAGGGGGGNADPTLLPVATGQTPGSPSFPGAAGGSYLDPVTNRRVWRVTDATTPVANERGNIDYADGGPFISLPWTAAGKTKYTILHVARVPPNNHYLVDFNYTDEVFENRRGPVASTQELTWAFSCNPATPRIAYYMTPTQIRRYDTALDADANIGNFPHTPAFLGGLEADWFSVDKDDRWFSCQKEFDGGTAGMWDSVNNVERSTSPNSGEPHMIRDGWGIMMAVNRASFHEELTGQVVSNTALLRASDGAVTTPDQPESHPAGTATGHFVAVDPNQSGGNQLYRFEVATGIETHLGARGAIIGSSNHSAAQWVVNNLSGVNHWFLNSGWGSSPILVDHIAFIPLNATTSNCRLLCHHYSAVTGDYYTQPHATMSPDGKLVMWEGNRNNGANRIDVWLTKVPTN